MIDHRGSPSLVGLCHLQDLLDHLRRSCQDLLCDTEFVGPGLKHSVSRSLVDLARRCDLLHRQGIQVLYPRLFAQLLDIGLGAAGVFLQGRGIGCAGNRCKLDCSAFCISGFYQLTHSKSFGGIFIRADSFQFFQQLLAVGQLLHLRSLLFHDSYMLVFSKQKCLH